MIEPDELEAEFLKTIKLPSNLLYLTEKLPAASYEPIKTRVSKKFAKSHINITSKDSFPRDLEESVEGKKTKQERKGGAKSVSRKNRDLAELAHVVNNTENAPKNALNLTPSINPKPCQKGKLA